MDIYKSIIGSHRFRANQKSLFVIIKTKKLTFSIIILRWESLKFFFDSLTLRFSSDKIFAESFRARTFTLSVFQIFFLAVSKRANNG